MVCAVDHVYWKNAPPSVVLLDTHDQRLQSLRSPSLRLVGPYWPAPPPEVDPVAVVARLTEQLQVPATQARPLEHARPQAPQLAGSVWVLEQVPLQLV